MRTSLRGFWLIFTHELLTTIGRRSFQIAVFGLPLFALACFGLLELFNNRSRPTISTPATVIENSASSQAEGFVDLSGLIHAIPSPIQPAELIAFPDERSARQALAAGQISRFYLIPVDYLETGKMFLYRNETGMLVPAKLSTQIKWLLAVNLLNGNEQLAARLNLPFKQVLLNPEPIQATESQFLVAFFLPFGVTLFFYITILMSASLLLGSLTVEKENRLLEILLTSISPGQLFSGKILGLGLAGLLQTVIWLGTGLLILRWGGRSLPEMVMAQFTAAFFASGILYFVLGYGLYACLMASIGALVKNLREASQFSILLLLPMLVPVLTISLLITAPNSSFIVGLSLFPLTSPVMMMARLVITPVPAWQIAASIILLLLAILVTLKVVARLFQLQTLLVGSTWSARRIFDLARSN